MGIPDLDYGYFIAAVFIIGGAVGAVAAAVFLFAPLPWWFYGGAVFGVLSCVGWFAFWSWIS